MPGDVLLSRPDRPLTLDDAAWRRLRDRLGAATALSAPRPRLISVTSRIQRPASLPNLLRGARTQGTAWTLIEEPDHHRRGLLTLGTAHRIPITRDQPGRLATAAPTWDALAADAHADPPGGIPGAGLIATVGMPFDPTGATGSTWAPFGPGEIHIPAISIATDGDAAALTVTTYAHPGDDPADHVRRIELATALLVAAPPPPVDPFADAPTVTSVLDPRHFTEAVAGATRRIAGSPLEKIVLAREVEVTGHEPWDPCTVLTRLADRFPACFIFGIGRGESAMVGASPELLLRRTGPRVETVALAGSARRSDDPKVDAHLADELLASAKDRREHDLVVQRITRTLSPHALWVTAPDEPQVISVANVHHLATPIRAHVDGAASLLHLVGAMHPTPAVGGEPAHLALPIIPELEGLDRGWYAAPLGWIDRTGDGQFFVGLRSGVLHDRSARLYAGVGVVADSDPASELAETEVKLGAMLSALRP